MVHGTTVPLFSRTVPLFLHYSKKKDNSPKPKNLKNIQKKRMLPLFSTLRRPSAHPKNPSWKRPSKSQGLLPVLQWNDGFSAHATLQVDSGTSARPHRMDVGGKIYGKLWLHPSLGDFRDILEASWPRSKWDTRKKLVSVGWILNSDPAPKKGAYSWSSDHGTIWVCLKIVYPYTQWLMIIIPTKWL